MVVPFVLLHLFYAQSRSKRDRRPERGRHLPPIEHLRLPDPRATTVREILKRMVKMLKNPAMGGARGVRSGEGDAVYG